MNITGVIVEYNPFHNGHLYHLQKTRETTKADILVAVMSGSFLQRGEPALIHKRSRTRMALAGGADLVVELPYTFSTQHASYFADGAVRILADLGVDTICFGSEQGRIQPFYDLLHFMKAHNNQYQTAIQKQVQIGISYPEAASRAFHSLQPPEGLPDLSQPNNILGFHYMKAIDHRKPSMKAATIQRQGAGYHDAGAKNGIKSATGIRLMLSEGEDFQETAPFLPETSFSELQKGLLMTWENYYPFLQHLLTTQPPDWLQRIYEVEEGLENRAAHAARQAQSFHEWMQRVKTKRYTWTRLQRMAVHILTQTTKAEMNEAMNTDAPTRLLGMNEAGQAYLKMIRHTTAQPIKTNRGQADSAREHLDDKADLTYWLPLTGTERIRAYQQAFAETPVRYERTTQIFKNE
ncbi:putative nucleotidyltransferase [Salsuginibacillus halophilus]|uniref:tRNA(Met) cytidine acetate ligase n=1 Tax=Salsuginibacillus halophilus TaxID=517424 RepID=A0A2P8HX32_9BACI|nr:nucleotidyltransferase [Salsuginibacillus halophilus]PSL50786.1 putative nucleotidyltransferase [Salsuginibacillus halophilus]